MQRRYVLIALGALLVLLIGGFGAARLLVAKNAVNTTLLAARPSTCDDAFRVLKLTASETAAARSVCLVQSLQISGELHGTIGQAYPVNAEGGTPTSMCSTPKRWDQYPQVLLAFVVGGKAYRLHISPPGWSEHQAVTLRNLQGQLDFTSIADPSVDWSQASGSIEVNADAVTGSINADLLRNVTGARPVHISGNWACGAPLAKSFDETAPCSLFYALNHLADADVARMKASACEPEDLTFSGAIIGHLDHAITDSAFGHDWGIDGDNNCRGAGAEYNASLKFSIGDESFLLDLYPRAYPSVKPGSYPAGSGAFSANAFLWLGRADPSNQGRFVTSQHVYWYGSGGGFTIAGDMKSGTIDETFSGLLDHSSSTVHLIGSWRCAA